VRVHWPAGWSEGSPDVRRLLDGIGGARAVRANELTRNVLVQFDERVTDARRVVARLEELAPAAPEPRDGRPRARPRVLPAAAPPSVAPTTLVLVERMGRAAGACAGLGIVALRGRGAGPLPGMRAAEGLAAAASVLDGSPELRALSRRVLGGQGR